MGSTRDIRRCAVQALYQFDAGSADAHETVRASLSDSPGDQDVHDRGFDLARRAWDMRENADAAVAALSPDWPTHRQPALDRTILRLAYFEMVAKTAPPKVVINEAVELAKEFSTEKSPTFVNGVLDKIYRSLPQAGTNGSDVSVESEPDR